MTIERSSSEPARHESSHQAITPNPQLDRLLRRHLTHHVRSAASGASFTLIGLDRDRLDVLDRSADSPERAVLGFVLPPRYSAVAVMASSIVAMPPRRRHADAALALAVERSGRVVSLLATTDRGIIATSDPHGWLIDACRRAVGLPTAPCDTASLAFPIALWLDRLMVALLGSSHGAPLTWRDAVELCPVPVRWRSDDPVDLGATLGSTTPSWQALRRATAAGIRSPVAVDPAAAEWMDDAMFARWCLGAFPDLSNLRADVEFLAPPDVAERIELALRSAWATFAD